MRKGRGTTTMGVISCRSRAASIIPNYIRVKATTKYYCSNLGTKTWDARRAPPGCEKACCRSSGSKARPLASSGDLQQHEIVGND